MYVSYCNIFAFCTYKDDHAGSESEQDQDLNSTHMEQLSTSCDISECARDDTNKADGEQLLISSKTNECMMDATCINECATNGDQCSSLGKLMCVPFCAE